MNRRIQITTVVLIVTLASSAALAQGQGRRGAGRQDGQCVVDGSARGVFGGGRMLAALDLSDEQTEQIKALHEASREKMIDLRKQLARLKNEMEGKLLEDSPSEKTVIALVEEIGALRTAVQVERMSTRLAVRDLLTDEQRDQLTAMRMHRGGRGEEFRGKGMRGHGGGAASGRHGMKRGGCGGPCFGAGFDSDADD